MTVLSDTDFGHLCRMAQSFAPFEAMRAERLVTELVFPTDHELRYRVALEGAATLNLPLFDGEDYRLSRKIYAYLQQLETNGCKSAAAELVDITACRFGLSGVCDTIFPQARGEHLLPSEEWRNLCVTRFNMVAHSNLAVGRPPLSTPLTPNPYLSLGR